MDHIDSRMLDAFFSGIGRNVYDETEKTVDVCTETLEQKLQELILAISATK